MPKYTAVIVALLVVLALVFLSRKPEVQQEAPAAAGASPAVEASLAAPGGLPATPTEPAVAEEEDELMALVENYTAKAPSFSQPRQPVQPRGQARPTSVESAVPASKSPRLAVAAGDPAAPVSSAPAGSPAGENPTEVLQAKMAVQHVDGELIEHLDAVVSQPPDARAPAAAGTSVRSSERTVKAGVQVEPAVFDGGVVAGPAVNKSLPGPAVVTAAPAQPAKLDEDKPYFLPLGQLPIQSPARPLDMELVGEVQASVDDPGYVEFMMETLPGLTPQLESHFKQRKEIEASSLEAEFEDLVLDQDSNVRIYFIKEGTVFHNTLGIGFDDEDKIIFPDASSVVSYFRDADTRTDLTTEKTPLLPGDYVDLGVMEAGSLVDLFLIQDGAKNEEGRMYGLDKEANPDKANHIRIHDVVDENTLIIGFEDLPGGGDRDYNDLVIAVEMIPVEQEP